MLPVFLAFSRLSEVGLGATISFAEIEAYARIFLFDDVEEFAEKILHCQSVVFRVSKEVQEKKDKLKKG